MHVMKCGASDYGKVKKEALREEGYHSKSGTIVREMSSENYSLIDNQAPEDIDEFIKSLGVKRKIKADAVRSVTIIVDYPKDEEKPEKEFFEDTIEGLKRYFGIMEESVLYAQVHLDEGHPHLHFAFAPTKETEKIYKDGHGEKQIKLAAKEIVTQEKLRNLHPWMQKYMDDRGYKGTLHHNDGIKRDKSFMEHKLDQIEKELEEKEEQIKEKNTELFSLKRNIQDLNIEKASLEDETEQLKKDKENLQSDVEVLELTKTGLSLEIKTLEENKESIIADMVDKVTNKCNIVIANLKKIVNWVFDNAPYAPEKRESIRAKLEKYQNTLKEGVERDIEPPMSEEITKPIDETIEALQEVVKGNRTPHRGGR